MEKKKKILVVEDEAAIALDIKMRLQAMNYEVPTLISKPHKVMPAVEEHQPDCVVMDINLKGNDEGIALAEEIVHGYEVPVVFLTAFTDKLTFNKASEIGPFGYLTKPFKDADLRNAIETALKLYKNLHTTRQKIVDLRKKVFELTMTSEPATNSIFIKDGSGYLNIKFDDILWIRADDIYSNVVTDESEMLVNVLLGDLVDKLPESLFIRVHRSYVVSINQIEKVTSESVIIKGRDIPISKSYKKMLFDRIS